ncbi:Ig-like domain-containing protein [Methanofollis fontis]|nr:Ig-like domain-containing protein [Methanofollis fontis]
MTIESDTEWLVVDALEQCFITATVLDGEGDPIRGIDVSFSVEDDMGILSPEIKKTDNNGKAKVNFHSLTRSGPAVITATLGNDDDDDDDDTLVTASFVQQIDHGDPRILSTCEYDSEITAGSETLIVLAMTDIDGNPIDSDRSTETVGFSVGSSDGMAGFYDGEGYISDIVVPVDGSGQVTTRLRTDPQVGENIILADLPSPMSDCYFTVYGIGNGVPASISCSVTPDGTPNPRVPADGLSQFSITYTLTDRYGNPAGGRDVRITALPGEERTITTNSDGLAMITYGPKESPGTVTLTATAVDNATVASSEIVEFINRAPSNMVLTASPQTMASHEVNPGFTATIRARVVDEMGNPVSGEEVAFTIEEIDGGDAADGAPALLSESAVTDSGGYAAVSFVPGGFILEPSDPDYDPMATGTCTVLATWNGMESRVDMTWKNYPYLSVIASIDPEIAEVNDTVRVNVTVLGDGWALQPDPIDVVLAIDSSGSMDDEVQPAGTKMEAAKTAALTFLGEMDDSRDRVGVVPYSTASAPVAVSLSNDHARVRTVIDALSPDGYTPTRLALKNAIEDLIMNPNPEADAVRAVVLLSDGAYNYFGDPLGRGEGSEDVYLRDGESNLNYREFGFCSGASTSPPYDFTTLTDQNLAGYAHANGIRIYCISFGDGIAEGDNTYDTMTILAESTGGFHEHAPDAETLEEIYVRISGELKTDAGVDTTMDLCFDTLQMNNLTVPNAAADPVLEYRFVQDESTLIESHIDNTTPSYVIIPPTTCDNTTYWEAHRSLAFDLGTVRLDQVWTAKFSLQAFKNGNINIFGAGSIIAFNEGADILPLPPTFVTVVPDLNNTGMDASTLDVWDLCRQGNGTISGFLQFAWNLNYTGTQNVTQRLYYSNDDRHTWIWFDTLSPVPPGNVTQSDELDVRELAEGNYWIRVRAIAPDAPDAIAETDAAICVGPADKPKILIE